MVRHGQAAREVQGRRPSGHSAPRWPSGRHRRRSERSRRQSRFLKVAELWLAEVEQAVDAGRRSPGTLNTYRSVYRRHVKPALGELRVREVTTPVVDRALAVIKEPSTARARTAKS